MSLRGCTPCWSQNSPQASRFTVSCSSKRPVAALDSPSVAAGVVGAAGSGLSSAGSRSGVRAGVCGKQKRTAVSDQK